MVQPATGGEENPPLTIFWWAIITVPAECFAL